MLRAAILRECQNYLGGGSALGGKKVTEISTLYTCRKRTAIYTLQIPNYIHPVLTL